MHFIHCCHQRRPRSCAAHARRVAHASASGKAAAKQGGGTRAGRQRTASSSARGARRGQQCSAPAPACAPSFFARGGAARGQGLEGGGKCLRQRRQAVHLRRRTWRASAPVAQHPSTLHALATHMCWKCVRIERGFPKAKVVGSTPIVGGMPFCSLISPHPGEGAPTRPHTSWPWGAGWHAHAQHQHEGTRLASWQAPPRMWPAAAPCTTRPPLTQVSAARAAHFLCCSLTRWHTLHRQRGCFTSLIMP